MNTEYITRYRKQITIKRYLASTIRTYLSQIQLFLSFFNGSDAKNNREDDVEAYIQKLLKEDKISFSIQKAVLGTIHLVTNFLHQDPFYWLTEPKSIIRY